MKNFFLFLLCVLFLTGCEFPIKTYTEEEIKEIINKTKDSELIVLSVYHYSCPSCKKIEPILEVLKNEYSNKAISFLKYDLSNPFIRNQGKKIAKELGLEDIYKTQRFSGVVLFIDNKSKLVLDTLIAEERIEKYREVIGEKLKQLPRTLD